jgi:hypothetical protein
MCGTEMRMHRIRDGFAAVNLHRLPTSESVGGRLRHLLSNVRNRFVEYRTEFAVLFSFQDGCGALRRSRLINSHHVIDAAPSCRARRLLAAFIINKEDEFTSLHEEHYDLNENVLQLAV